MTFTDRIEINPRVMLGKPVIRGTRIPVEFLLRKLSEGASEADLLDGYPRLTREDIHAGSSRSSITGFSTARASTRRCAPTTASRFLFDRHMRRLRRSADMLALPIPITDAEMDGRFRETVNVAGLGPGADREAYIRVLVTRGVGELTYDPAACPVSSVVVIVKPNVDPPREVFERGVKVALVGVVRNHPGTVNPLIKSNNLLNNALAMQEAFRQGGYEGVMRNYKGELAECTQSNLFIVKHDEALTPPIDAGLLPGITREYLFEVGAEAGIPVREVVLRDADLFGADEAFLTSTTREAVPIVQVDDRTIGSGTPGPVTRALLDAFRKKARGT